VNVGGPASYFLNYGWMRPGGVGALQNIINIKGGPKPIEITPF